MELKDGAILDPCSLYGERKDGKLVTTPARGGNPEAVGFLRQLPWAEVLSLLKADPRGYSLV
eukprot:3336807-Prymnesium_polylepis.1